MSYRKIFYIVEETQVDNGIKSNTSLIFDNEDETIACNQAYARYYQILSSASVSLIEYHAARILRSDGMLIDTHTFDRREEEPAE